MRHATRGGAGRMVILAALVLVLAAWATGALAESDSPLESFPRPLDSYEDASGLWQTLTGRATAEPFNFAATLIFLLAIVHTFLTSRFHAIAERWSKRHEEKIARGEVSRDSVHPGAELMRFLGEVEVVFGLWAIPLMAVIGAFYGWSAAVHYVGETVDFTEAAFVVVVMTLAATRPILRLAEAIIGRLAALLGGSLAAHWFTTLTIGPLLGSFITEPAGITISALLLARSFYALEPSARLRYGTLGLLLVNVSIGGTLTHFAAPPVLMVAGDWGWDTSHMLLHFGWKAATAIVVSNALYLAFFRREIASLEGRFRVLRMKREIQTRLLKREDVDARFEELRPILAVETGTRALVKESVDDLVERIRAQVEADFASELRDESVDAEIFREAFAERFEEIRLRALRRLVPAVLDPEKRGPFVDPDWDGRDDPVPAWVTAVHVLFMGWTILNAHDPPLFILGLLFFLGFSQVSRSYQNRIDLKPAMLVGFFLAGLVIHGGVQGWWIAPILGGLGEIPLLTASMVLTAFNDNAAITYLATLVPDFSDALEYAVVAGAVTGGGLTIIANAPNPAGISLLRRYFEQGVSPVGLLAAALGPTLIAFSLFLATR